MLFIFNAVTERRRGVDRKERIILTFYMLVQTILIIYIFHILPSLPLLFAFLCAPFSLWHHVFIRTSSSLKGTSYTQPWTETVTFIVCFAFHPPQCALSLFGYCMTQWDEKIFARNKNCERTQRARRMLHRVSFSIRASLFGFALRAFFPLFSFIFHENLKSFATFAS